MKKNYDVRKINESEVIQLHDFYFESSEPDAPKDTFSNLMEKEKIKARTRYSLDTHYIVLNKTEVIGFFGLYLHFGSQDLNIFYVMNPALRGRGFFIKFLHSLIDYVRSNFVSCKKLIALTRTSNYPSVRGLERALFVYSDTHTEEYSDDPNDDVVYGVYILPLTN